MRNYYKGDPRWIVARYKGKCSCCGTPILKGDKAYYYPNGKKILCASPCGFKAEGEFLAAAEDEYFMSGGCDENYAYDEREGW